jgi:hypothetical protein
MSIGDRWRTVLVRMMEAFVSRARVIRWARLPTLVAKGAAAMTKVHYGEEVHTDSFEGQCIIIDLWVHDEMQT